jgi:hypothetical protein
MFEFTITSITIGIGYYAQLLAPVTTLVISNTGGNRHPGLVAFGVAEPVNVVVKPIPFWTPDIVKRLQLFC